MRTISSTRTRYLLKTQQTGQVLTQLPPLSRLASLRTDPLRAAGARHVFHVWVPIPQHALKRLVKPHRRASTHHLPLSSQ